MERSKVLTALSALAHESRLDLVRLLMPTGSVGMAAGDIGRHLGLSASRLSFHLATLEQAGLIRSRRVARNVIYAVEPGGIGRTLDYVLRDCCMDNAEVRACCVASRSDGPIAPDIDLTDWPEPQTPAPDRSGRGS